MAAARLSQFGTKHIAKGIGRLSSDVLESGAGSYVTTTEGKKYLDFTCGQYYTRIDTNFD